MSNFNIEFIKQIAPTTILYRGQSIYKNNYLTLLKKEIINISNERNQLIFIFSCLASQSNEEYKVGISFLYFNNKVELEKVTCNCMYVLTNRSDCKHIIGALLYCFYKSNGDILQWSGFLQPTTDLINFFKMQQSSNKIVTTDTIDCKITCEIINENKAALKFSVGIKNFQEVKDINEFLELLMKEKPTFVQERRFANLYGIPLIPESEQYSNKFLRLLKFLKEETELFNHSQIAQFNYVYHKNRSNCFNMLALQTERFFKFMKNERIDLVIKDTLYANVPITEKYYQVNLSVKLQDNKILIKNEKTNPLFLTIRLQTIFDNNKISFLQDKYLNSSGFILQTMNLQNKNEILFDEKGSQEAFQYIIPVLKQETDIVTIDEQIPEYVENNSLVIESYFDFDGKSVILKPIFNYSKVFFDIDNNRNHPTKLVIRDYDKEKKYYNFINLLPFVKQDNQLFLSDINDIMKLLDQFLPPLEEHSTIYYTDDFKKVRFIEFKLVTSAVRLNPENSLLEFDFSLGKIPATELQAIFNAMKSTNKYHRLEDGAIIDLQNKTLQKFAKLIDKFDVPVNVLAPGKLKLPKFNAFFLEQQLKSFKGVSIKKDQFFKDFVKKVKNFAENKITINSNLNATLRDYQIKGHQWLKTLAGIGFGGILADEMGLGKTLQTISYIAQEYEENPSMKPILIIGPASIIYNWESEFNKFAPHIKTIVIAGDKATRKSILSDHQNYQVLITSYPLLRRDFTQYESLSFSHCFIDEAQHIKNPTSLNAKATKDINAPIRFALTGTPIENNLTELWSIFDFVLPGFLLSHHKFKKQYETPIVKNEDKLLLNELNSKVQPFILRRLKKDVTLELPDKIENKIIIEMTDRQKKMYSAYVSAAKKDLDATIDTKGFNQSKIKILAVLTMLRQICCDPSILNEGYANESSKIDALKDMLSELIGLGHKILIFSQFTCVLKNIAPICEKLNINFLYLDGSTKTQSRLAMVEEFNNDKNISVFLISLKAGGVGLNLTSADVVIHFDPWWNPSTENQATDRAHRIGQKKVVQVIKLITKGTIEEKIITIQDKKRAMIDSVIDSSDDAQLITNLSETELKSLLDLN
ncbi:DEAD/DEAH box helicase [Spiroplasma endosymbiont of Virgichneumon dumeticola]|uniref:DEAD/DEAH box helicase n=1 Tax=Spiroplasma endosymbiont of Virgichneumon dumeticola TaxID=3139323 RepID=UPI0035C8C581